MRGYFLILSCIFSSWSCQAISQKNFPLKTINSSTDYIRYVINGNERGWRITPSVKPDVLKFECLQKDNIVSFITDVDTISFNIQSNDTIQFGIILNKDTAYTEIIGMPKNVNFDDVYKKTHENEISVAIPEVSELANIIIAISDLGLQDSNIVNKKIPYREEVLKWFLPYKKLRIIKYLDSCEAKNNWSDNYKLYYAVKMNACGYYLDQDNLLQDSTILDMATYDFGDPFKANLKAIEDFAKKSDFKTFYSNHKLYYDSLVLRYKESLPVSRMKNRLQSEFSHNINYYIITFSPLVYGAHSAHSYYDNDFSVSAMFVAPVEYTSKMPVLDKIRDERLLFTEIDHNYVNPISYKYIDDINYIFKDKLKWQTGHKDGFYPDAFSVFNEYMTWSVFTLYCYNNYPEKDVQTSMQFLENFMEKKRGFINYAAFDHALLNIYKRNKRKKKVCELYPEILKWCSSQ